MDDPAEALEEARQAGIDLSLIDASLALSYEERVLQHQSALELALALRRAGAVREKSSPSSSEIS
jgi:hypothetical protein